MNLLNFALNILPKMLSKVSSPNPEGDRRRRGCQPRRDRLHGRLGARGERGGPLWRRHARDPAEGPQRADAQQGRLLSTVLIFHCSSDNGLYGTLI